MHLCGVLFPRQKCLPAVLNAFNMRPRDEAALKTHLQLLSVLEERAGDGRER